MHRIVWGILGGGLAAALARGGGGPTDVLVVYDPVDANSVAIANHYQQTRNIPEVCMVPYSFPKTRSDTSSIKDGLSAAEGLALIQALKQAASNRNISAQIDRIVLAGFTPTTVSPGRSLTTMLAYGPMISTTSDMAVLVADYTDNRAFRGTGTNPAVEIRNDVSFNGHYYWVATSIGYTGARGNPAADIFSLVSRSKAADGTRPDGTVYWPTNSDIRSTTRAWQIPGVTNEWNALGVDYAIVNGTVVSNKTGAPGSFPVDQRAIIGEIAGVASFDTNQNNVFLPGCIAEHLTSGAGVLGSVGGQTSLAAWIALGVCGSSGTVVEPYAVWEKFPHARLHSHYAMGASLGEAFWESVANPVELFIVGDPLTQPFADLPTVAFTHLVDGAVLSNTVFIGVSASCAVGVEADLDLAVDGRVLRIGDGREPVGVSRTAGGFTLNTATLSDGFHELRAIAYAATPVRAQGYASRRIRVDNEGRRVTLTGPRALDRRDSMSVTVTVLNAVGSTNVTIELGGRILATLPGTGGVAVISGTQIAYRGTNELWAVARRSDGRHVRSDPLAVEGSWSRLPAVQEAPPLATGKVAYVRYFYNTTAAGFSWTNTPTATCFLNRPSLNIPAPHTNFPFITGEALMNAGHEFVMYFLAPTDDVYDFTHTGNMSVSVLLDGRILYTNLTYASFPIATESLAAGFHELRIRAVCVNTSSWSFNNLHVYPRGGGYQNYLGTGRDTLMDGTVCFAPNWPVFAPTNPPTVAITSPTNGQILVGSNTFAITATAFDSDGVIRHVEFYEGTNRLGTDASEPFGIVWSNVPAGVYTLTALARDDVGMTGVSRPVQITVATLPTPDFAPGGRVFPSPVVVTVTCAATGVDIRYTLDGRDPTAADSLVGPGGTVTVSRTAILKARAFKPGESPSGVRVALYAIGRRPLAGSAYGSHAFKPDESVWGWGNNAYGQIGDGTLENRLTAVPLAGAHRGPWVVAGYYHGGMIDAGGIPRLWGYNGSFQLGDGTNVNRTSPIVPLGPNPVAGLACGGNFTWFVDASGKAWSCGNNTFGQLGDGTTTTRSIPVPVKNGTNVLFVAAGNYHTLFLTADGAVWACGYNGFGALGDGTTTARSTPVRAVGISNAVAVAAGGYHSVALLSNGTVLAWGYGFFGQLGTGSNVNSLVPALVTGVSNVVDVAAGQDHTLALTADGRLFAWGRNASGQLGDGRAPTNRLTPTPVAGLTGLVAMAAGQNHSLAMDSEGRVWAWGDNSQGQLGDKTTIPRALPITANGDLTGPWMAADLADFSYVTNQPLVLSGTATDFWNVAALFVNGLTPVTPNAFTNWSISLGGLVLGTNRVTLVGTDGSWLPNTRTALVSVIYVSGDYDGDEDGVPDEWMVRFFGSRFPTNPLAAASADADHDGLDNRSEFLAGTSPTDAASCLTIQHLAAGPEAHRFTLAWQSVPERIYRVQYATTLTQWFDTGLALPSEGVVTTWTDDGSRTGGIGTNSARRFYRILVVP